MSVVRVEKAKRIWARRLDSTHRMLRLRVQGRMIAVSAALYTIPFAIGFYAGLKWLVRRIFSEDEVKWQWALTVGLSSLKFRTMLALVMTAGLAADISMDRWRTHYFLTFPEWALLLQVVYLNIGAFTTWHFRPAASGEITRHDASVTSRRILRLNSELLAVSGPNAFIASAVFFVGEVPFMRSFGSHIRDRPTSIFPHVLNIGAAVFDAHFVTQPKFVVNLYDGINMY